MNTLVWVLAGAGAYWLAVAALDARGLLPEAVRAHGPFVTIHTTRGRQLIERIAAPRRFWRAWGNFGLGIALVVMLGSIVALVASAALTALNPPDPSALNQPSGVVVIPGYNPFLPLSVAPEIVAGLVLGLVVHEFGHGILCRAGDIGVDSLGLFFITVIPAGAFVQQDEESTRQASRGDRARMFAAGVTNNFALTALAFALLFGPVVGSVAVAPGAAVASATDGSPAAAAGIGNGDVVTSVAGREVGSNDELGTVLGNVSAQEVEVGLRDGRTATVGRAVLVTGVPAVEWVTDLPRNRTITAVNGTEVATSAAFAAAVENRSHVTVATERGGTYSLPVGAYVGVTADGPLGASDIDADTAVVAAIDGEPVRSDDDLYDALADTSAGQTVEVLAYTAAGRDRYEVTLDEHPRQDTGLLGVSPIYAGVSGVQVSDFGVETYPAGLYLSALGGDCERCPELELSAVSRVGIALQMPILGAVSDGVFPYNFAGFAGGVENFYVVDGGPLAWLGGLLFLLANLLFWTGWINLNLGVFNCFPTFMLDGGHMFRATTGAAVARLPIDDARRAVEAATLAVQAAIFAGLIVVLFGPTLL
jgi:membrane-associated protease RseP (regulator of RpoE activity)